MGARRSWRHDRAWYSGRGRDLGAPVERAPASPGDAALAGRRLARVVRERAHAGVRANRHREGRAEIRLVDRGRRRDRRLVGGRLPRWSPNGRRIAYQHANDVWTVRRDGRGRRRLVDNDPDGATAGWHDWSPDGRWLVSRGVAPNGDPFDPQLQLRFVRADGKRERRLTLPAQVEYASPLSWQPRP